MNSTFKRRYLEASFIFFSEKNKGQVYQHFWCHYNSAFAKIIFDTFYGKIMAKLWQNYGKIWQKSSNFIMHYIFNSSIGKTEWLLFCNAPYIFFALLQLLGEIDPRMVLLKIIICCTFMLGYRVYQGFRLNLGNISKMVLLFGSRLSTFKVGTFLGASDNT